MCWVSAEVMPSGCWPILSVGWVLVECWAVAGRSLPRSLASGRSPSPGGYRAGAQGSDAKAGLLGGQWEHPLSHFSCDHKMRNLVRTPEKHLWP